jgi:hypothetical protein
MAKAGYSAITGADVSLTAATAKTVLGVLAPSSFGLDLIEASVSFDGTTAGFEPVLVEICYATFATNPPGTQSTSVTPVQKYGRTIAHGCTAARSWNAANEPTVLTPFKEVLIHPQAGVVYQIPLGQTPDSDVSDGFAIRVTAPNAVACRAELDWERC